MSLSEDNNQPENEAFGAEWRQIFNEAAETPPDRVWNAIERRLDEDDRGTVVIPFWSRFRPVAYGMAAAVTLLLLGWWAFQTYDQPANSPDATMAVKSRQPALESNPNPATRTSRPEEKRIADASSSEAPSPAQKKPATRRRPAGSVPGDGSSGRPSLAQNRAKTRYGSLRETEPQPSVPDANGQRTASARSFRQSMNADPSAPTQSAPAFLPSSPPVTDQVVISRLEQPIEPVRPNTGSEAASYTPLAGKPLRLTSKSGIDRVVWYRVPDAGPVIEPERASKKEYWTAVAFVPTSFNPSASVSTRGLTPAPAFTTSNQSFTTRQSVSQAELQNQPQLSIALQFNTGVKLADHWSLETGINYLEGRSQVRSNAVVVTGIASIFAQGNKSSSILENAILNSSSAAPSRSYGFASSDVLLAAADNTPVATTNNYQFLQVPLQAGYHIRPRKKLSYTLLGGFLANLFLRNSVGSLEVAPRDQIYRPVTLSGMAGMRFSYRPTRRWSGSLTGSFQQALQSGTRPEALFQTRPQALGVGFGVNYHF